MDDGVHVGCGVQSLLQASEVACSWSSLPFRIYNSCYGTNIIYSLRFEISQYRSVPINVMH